MKPLVSVVVATRNKDKILAKVLASIYRQSCAYPLEVVVVDDGSTDNTRETCLAYPDLRYIRLEGGEYRNSCFARNCGYWAANGMALVLQSDDVVHVSERAVEKLVDRLGPGEFTIATVYNYDPETNAPVLMYTGTGWKRPFFFLGAIRTEDIYAVGGNEEELLDVGVGFDDTWLADCLTLGQGLTPVFMHTVLGYHQNHRPLIPGIMREKHADAKLWYEAKVRTGRFVTSTGAWTERMDPDEWVRHYHVCQDLSRY